MSASRRECLAGLAANLEARPGGTPFAHSTGALSWALLVVSSVSRSQRVRRLVERPRALEVRDFDALRFA
jgi:hypothetical protein